MTDSTFSAGPQALGYLYQVRFGLLTALRARDDQAVAIERLDDIDLSGAEAPLTLAQLKHHITRSASLSDTSSDLWKTLRVWSETLSEGRWDPDAVSLHLVTTGAAPADSAASFLRPDSSRDPATALQRLVTAASGSTSKDPALQKSFTAFLSLSDPDRLRLLGAMVVFDDAPNVVDLETQIRHEIRHASPPESAVRDQLYEALEGWWFRTAVDHLAGGAKDPIPVARISRKLWSLTQELRPTSLPISFVESEPADPVDPASDPRRFVQQLRALEINVDRVKRAILDYYRAFEQRSYWLTHDLLVDDDIDRYERRLIDAWTGLKLQLQDDLLHDGAGEEECINVGRRLLRWMETKAEIPIRPEVVDGFVMRGSYHMLADENPPRVIWHPKFLERLEAVMSR